jgi:hypothetical protein
VLVEGVKIGLAIGETNAFKKLGTKFWDQIPMPGRQNIDLMFICSMHALAIYIPFLYCPVNRRDLCNL